MGASMKKRLTTASNSRTILWQDVIELPPDCDPRIAVMLDILQNLICLTAERIDKGSVKTLDTYRRLNLLLTWLDVCKVSGLITQGELDMIEETVRKVLPVGKIR